MQTPLDAYESSQRPNRQEVRRHIFGYNRPGWEFFHNKRGFNFYQEGKLFCVEEYWDYERGSLSFKEKLSFPTREEAEVHIDKISNKFKARSILGWMFFPVIFLLFWYLKIFCAIFSFTPNK